MIGIVVVSHSAKLAEGVRDLAEGMTGVAVQIAAAGGGPDGGLGTDVDRIREAIVRVKSDDGVLVLMDLGSAVLSTQMAVEMLEDASIQVILSNASLVEGAVVAAVEASIGKTLADVNQAAEKAATMRKVE